MPSPPPSGTVPPAEPTAPQVDLIDVVLILQAAVFSIILCVAIGTVLLYIFRGPTRIDARQLALNPFFVIPTQVAAYLIVVGFMAFIVWVRHGQGLSRAVGWNAPSRQLLLSAVAAGVVLGLFSELSSDWLQRWTPKSLPIDEYFRDPGAGYLLAAFGVLFAPLVEELFFRGFLFPAVARWTGNLSAILITAGAFAALHGAQLAYAWAPLLVLFGIGAVLTVIRARTQSVATCVIIHMGYNLTLFITLFFGTDHFRHMERAQLDSSAKKLLTYQLNGHQRTPAASQAPGGKLLPAG